MLQTPPSLRESINRLSCRLLYRAVEKDKVFTAALQQLEPDQKVYDAVSTTLFVCLLACMRASVCVLCTPASVSRFFFGEGGVWRRRPCA